jgi:hypothetical protein
MQLIAPDMDYIRSVIRKKKPAVYLFFGKKDSIIPSSIGHYFVKDMADLCELTVVDSGHRLLTKENLKLLQQKVEKSSFQ